MTLKERRFADFYIELGNAAEAARKAGYTAKSARDVGWRLLNKSEVKIYVNASIEQMEAEKLASLQEVLEFYSAVLRGQIKDQFGLDASIQDRLKAADALMKRYLVADDRNNSTLTKLDDILQEFREAINENDA